jgi:hypothetical protein
VHGRLCFQQPVVSRRGLCREQTWCVVSRRGQCRGQRRGSSAGALFATKETSETPKSAKGGRAGAGVQNSAYSDLQQLGQQRELGELVELHVVLNERPHPATQGVLTGYSRGTQGAELRVVLGRPRQTDRPLRPRPVRPLAAQRRREPKHESLDRMRPGVRRSAVLRGPVRTGPSVRQALNSVSGTGLPESAFLGGAKQLLEPFLRWSEQLVHLRWLHAEGGP